MFGNTGLPFVPVYVHREHAAKFKDRFPLAVDTLSNSTLIDDVLDSLDSLGDATDTMEQIQSILDQAGMQMAKCHSNHPGILASLPRDAVAPGFVDISRICQKDPDLIKLRTLGIRCDPVEDEFYFDMEEPTVAVWSRRNILKTFPRLFDPLGLLLPFVITARIYFSELITEDKNWDKTVSPSKLWTEWLRQLRDLSQVRFPRCIKALPVQLAQLHMFADASEKAYAAAAYIRTEEPSGNVTVRLVRAKAHVAPIKKPQTIQIGTTSRRTFRHTTGTSRQGPENPDH